jgi:hypothetical protein
MLESTAAGRYSESPCPSSVDVEGQGPAHVPVVRCVCGKGKEEASNRGVGEEEVMPALFALYV